jgi:hypothetical protein
MANSNQMAAFGPSQPFLSFFDEKAQGGQRFLTWSAKAAKAAKL